MVFNPANDIRTLDLERVSIVVCSGCVVARVAASLDGPVIDMNSRTPYDPCWADRLSKGCSLTGQTNYWFGEAEITG